MTIKEFEQLTVEERRQSVVQRFSGRCGLHLTVEARGPVTPEQILSGRVHPPLSARPLIATLSQY
jgi:hypothetical protein